MIKVVILLLALASPAWATNAGYFVLTVNTLTSATLSSSANRFLPLSGPAPVLSTSNANPQTRMFVWTPVKLSCTLSAAPGVGKSYTITLEATGSDTDCSCQVSGTATTCEDTSCNDALTGGGNSNCVLKFVPAGTPTVSVPYCYIIGQSF